MKIELSYNSGSTCRNDHWNNLTASSGKISTTYNKLRGDEKYIYNISRKTKEREENVLET
jgi:hypothetical protein